MKKDAVTIIYAVVIVLLIVWAVTVTNSRNDLSKQCNSLKAELMKRAKDGEFFEDKSKSLEEKLTIKNSEKDELVKTLNAKDEVIATLESSLKEAGAVNSQLQKKIKELRDILTELQKGALIPQQE